MILNIFTERFGSGGFVGEHLWLGHLGHLLIIISFFATILSFIAYFASELSTETALKDSWKKMARVSFITHGISVFLVFVLLFVMILNHWFEYHYAWRHSSTDLPLKYIISSFWEGQEGSFLLWIFWIALLGAVAIFTTKNYEQPVMAVVSLTQMFLTSMVLGVYVFGFKLGSSPFILLRHQVDLKEMAPVVFSNPENMLNYLAFIKDGQGLNELLQNYWMTIHPPVLFLGFASLSFPFAFAIAALLRKDWDGWIKPALPWVLFGIASLGTGILMGGAWAYESLSFGGFWAWDPVENMSFVPWLMLVAGLHTMLVYRYSKHSLISSLVFLILSFVFVLYSTYLTRSGRLGETSVHSFTDDGLEPQLLAYMAFFFFGSFTLLLIRSIKKQMPSAVKEEELWSREFWMFIGALVLLLSSVQMLFTTSIPIWNLLFHDIFKLLENKLAPPEDVVLHYNSIQIWLGILVALLSGAVQYFAYKSGKLPSTAKWASYSILAALVVSVLVAFGTDIPFTQQYKIDLSKISDALFLKFPFVSAMYLFLFAAVYAAISNLAYMFLVLKGNFRLTGGSISHFGFGLFLVGVIISQGKKEVISTNGVNARDFDAKEKAENILLVKDSAEIMGPYRVTYIGPDEERKSTFYNVKYEALAKDGSVKSTFTLRPEAGLMKGGSLNSNPDTKHYLHKDVFTHITSVPDNSKLRDSLMRVEMSVGDTFYTRTSYIVLQALNPKPDVPEGFDATNKLMLGARLEISDMQQPAALIEPVLVINLSERNAMSTLPASADAYGITADIERVNPEKQTVSLIINEREKAVDFIIMKAIIFPYINLVWLGGIITFLGAFVSMYRRNAENR